MPKAATKTEAAKPTEVVVFPAGSRWDVRGADWNRHHHFLVDDFHPTAVA
jgi:hypothetical protein